MDRWPTSLLLAAFLLAGSCFALPVVLHSPELNSPQRSGTENSVHEFMEGVARGVTTKGPIAWEKYFESTPNFFMAVNGQMAFASGAAAMAGIPNAAKMYPHIELLWGDDLRVDPLTSTLAIVGSSYHENLTEASGHHIDAHGFFTGTAEYRDGRWQFRNVHWSSPIANQ